MNDVKPCPFCGDDTAVEVREGSTFRWRVAVCGNCGAQAGEARINTTNPDRATREANGRAAAIREWNTRLGEQPAQAVPFLDCRTCAHFTRKAGGCMSVVQCVNGDKFVATRPHQYWEAAPEGK